MGWIRALILVSAWIGMVTAQVVSRAQSPQGPAILQLGTPIERTIAPGQAHVYQVLADENSLVQITVEQRGIDVVVVVHRPPGGKTIEYDSPNGADGPENVSFVTTVKLPYRIEVRPLSRDPGPAGRYEIKLIEQRSASEQELKESTDKDGLKARGLALLAELEGVINELRLPQTRIKAQMQVAQLLWESDERRALKYMTDATTSFRELRSNLDPASSEYTKNYHVINALRYEMVQMISSRQPEMALSFMRSTPPLADPYGNQRDLATQEAAMELEIANQLIQKDPKRAVEIAREGLKSRFSSSLITTIDSLRHKNPDMAAELATEVANKLLSQKLLKDSQAAHVLVSLIQMSGGNQNPQPQTNGVTPPRPLLSEQQRRDLLQKAVRDALEYNLPPQVYSPARDYAWSLANNLQSLGSEVDTVVNGGAASLQKRIKEYAGYNNPQMQAVQEMHNAVNDPNKPLDEIIQILSKAPREQKDQLYVQLSNRVLNSGDPARAKQIVNDYVTTPYQRQQALYNLEMQEMYRSMQKGKVEDALRNIAALPNPQERAQMLAQMANQIGPGYKRAAALLLLEQARGLLPPSTQAQDQSQMQALFEIAKGFARYDSKRAFEVFDPLVDQFNELSAAARTMQGFVGEFYDQDELNLHNGNSIAGVAQQLSSTLGTLGLSNFERARATAERIRLPEVRFRAYLDIAQQAIQNPR